MKGGKVRVDFGGPEVMHLFIQSQDMSLCGGKVREQKERQTVTPAYVPIVLHYSDICPICLYQLEIGPVDEGNNRVLPVSRFIHTMRER